MNKFVKRKQCKACHKLYVPHRMPNHRCRPKKLIAVVHWMDGEEEGARKFYDQDNLETFENSLRLGNYVHWVCMCDGQAVVMPRQRKGTAELLKRFSRTNSPQKKTGA